MDIMDVSKKNEGEDTSDNKGKCTKAIKSILNNYMQNEKKLVDQLYFECSNHGGTIGGFRESIWKEMFLQIIPKKFVIEQSVFIIDSFGKISNEVDLAIFDETYTPYIFHYEKLKFIPIEAVAVVIECKSKDIEPEKIINWLNTITVLKTSNKSIARMHSDIVVGRDIQVEKEQTSEMVKADNIDEVATEESRDKTQNRKNDKGSTQTATRPLRILCTMDKSNIKLTTEIRDGFDFIIRAPRKNDGLEILMNKTKNNLKDWYLTLNHAQYENMNSEINSNEKKINEKINSGEILGEINWDKYIVNMKAEKRKRIREIPLSLLTFNLQLNQLLMLINNPILFPHQAYAKMFNDIGMKGAVSNE
jgi:hypothetical protein